MGLTNSEDSQCPLSSSSAAADSDKSPVVFYGVWHPPNSPPVAGVDHQGVFTDRKEALLVVKNNREARFKAFASYEEAYQFSKQTPTQFNSSYGSGKSPSVFLEIGGVSEMPPTGPALSAEKGSAFRAPKAQELVKLRKAIQSGDSSFFKQTIWDNPRYLVSSGDSPAILHEGSRFNALHVASNSKQPNICRLILDTIEDPNFMQLLYNDDTEYTRIQRVNNLVDLYLNMPDKGLCETPLHFAAKYGCSEIVQMLAIHPACDKLLKNKYGQIAKDIICSRCPGPNTDQKLQIEKIFEDHYFVPVLASEDNTSQPFVGEPWTPDRESDLCPLKPPDGTSPLQPAVVMRAYAGPMSAKQAKELHQRWRRPSFTKCSTPASGRTRLLGIRLSDNDKGLERIGRELAKELNVPWLEKWPFSESYCDLSKRDGLSKLETHLRNTYSDLCSKAVCLELEESPIWKHPDFPVFSESESVNDTHQTSTSTCSSLGGLCAALRRLRLSSTSESGSLSLDRSKDGLWAESFRKACPGGRATPPPLQELTARRILDQVCVDVAGRVVRQLHERMASRGKAGGTDFVEPLKPGIECLIRVARHSASVNGAETDLRRLHFGIAELVGAGLEDEYSVTDFRNWIGSSGGCWPASNSDDEDRERHSVHWRRFPTASVWTTEEIVLQHVRCILDCLKTRMANEPDLSEGFHDCCCDWRPDLISVNGCKLEEEAGASKKSVVADGGADRSRDVPEWGHEPSCSTGDKNRGRHSDQKLESWEDSLSVDENWNCTKAPTSSDDSASVCSYFTPPSSFLSSHGSSLSDDVHTPDEGIPVFINGSQPTKLDVDVMRALEGIEVDPAIYPHIRRWQFLISTFSRDEVERWATPLMRGRRPQKPSWQSPGSFDWPPSPLGQRFLDSLRSQEPQTANGPCVNSGKQPEPRLKSSEGELRSTSTQSEGTSLTSPLPGSLRRKIF